MEPAGAALLLVASSKVNQSARVCSAWTSFGREAEGKRNHGVKPGCWLVDAVAAENENQAAKRILTPQRHIPVWVCVYVHQRLTHTRAGWVISGVLHKSSSPKFEKHQENQKSLWQRCK